MRMKLTLYEEVALNGKRDGNIYHNRHSFVIGMLWYFFASSKTVLHNVENV